MVFIESAVFTRQVRELLTDEEYGDLQWHLALHPKAGAAIQDTGGLRKVRWASDGSGKRGGVRVIYFHGEPESGPAAADLSQGREGRFVGGGEESSSPAQREMVGEHP